MNEDSHIGGVASALVMLAAIALTYTTYSFYNDEKVAEQYTADQASLEETANALASLRIYEESLRAQALEEATSTSSDRDETSVELE